MQVPGVERVRRELLGRLPEVRPLDLIDIEAAARGRQQRRVVERPQRQAIAAKEEAREELPAAIDLTGRRLVEDGGAGATPEEVVDEIAGELVLAEQLEEGRPEEVAPHLVGVLAELERRMEDRRELAETEV